METTELYERIRFRGEPKAHPDALVVAGNARFTVLTPRMVRLEWSETGAFEDRSTYAFPTRYTDAPPPFRAWHEAGALHIDTGALRLRYREAGGRFTAETLAIDFELNGERRTWRPGMANPHNLGGTCRTLDRCAGDTSLGEGPISRDGWALFDDSRNVLFGEDGWVAPRPDFALQDWVFFGYGHDYKAALAEYARFGGGLELIPRFVLGGWWSRYWEYSEQDLRDLVAEFEAHGVPLDVLVIDMDWHTPDGWTGYTWNRELFPDPPAFLCWVHDKGLRATLNLHPADGVHPHEEVYPRFAEAMGIDPASGEPVPFRIADKAYVRHYFEMLHHPMEDEGVDFWWMDWQQGEIAEVKGLDPLPWINHLHFNDIRRHGVRPMLYSRWGGLGNHRYYIGFSGDTFVTWEALQFQPFMTATASNVLYGWWSHDIGGHMGGATEPELFARWVQFGALSPVLRLHSTKDPRCERRPWAYPEPVYRAAKAAFLWRYQLLPYLYSLARASLDSCISLCRPMYYEHPEVESAYAARYQYYLGDQAIAAPIVFPANPETGLARTDVWLPEGTWIAHDTLETFEGPGWVRLLGDLDRIPLLVRAGGILPLAAPFAPQAEPRLSSGTTDAQPRDALEIEVFPGEGAFRLYEDDGLTEAYKEGEGEWTPLRTALPNAETWTFSIGAVEGRCAALPSARSYTVRLMGCAAPEQVLLDGAPAETYAYDAERRIATVEIPKRDKRQATALEVRAAGGIVALGAAHNGACVAADVRRLMNDEALMEDGTPPPLDKLQGPGQLDAVARLGGPFASVIEFVTPEEAGLRMGRVIVGAPQGGMPYDVEIAFTCLRAGAPEQHFVRHKQMTEPLIVDTPFAFDGQVQGAVWSAEIALWWQGKAFRQGYRSRPFFPAVPRWSATVYRQDDPAAPDLAALFLEDGQRNPALEWHTLAQTVEESHNLNEPYVIRFGETAWAKALQAGAPLAAYLAARITAPEAREAVIEFLGTDPVAFQLNGEPVSISETAVDPDVPAHFLPIRRSERVHLRAGENLLLVDTRATPEPGAAWYLGAQFVFPDGSPMADLIVDEA